MRERCLGVRDDGEGIFGRAHVIYGWKGGVCYTNVPTSDIGQSSEFVSGLGRS